MQNRVFHTTLSKRLAISFLVVIIIVGSIGIVVGTRLISISAVKETQAKVKMDLNSAREIYRYKTECLRNIVRFTADRFFVRNAIQVGDVGRMHEELIRIRKNESLDVLTLTDNRGKVVFRTRNPAVFGDDQSGDCLVSRVLLKRAAVASTVVVSKQELEKEGEDLAEQAHLKVIPTLKALPKHIEGETSGMMIKAAAPVLGKDGHLLGVLYGGVLLNRNYGIVDAVKETVYQDAKYRGKDIGTVTIFQDDLRISTNVRNDAGERAIGTRVSHEVYEQVVKKGLPWIHRAFVVNDWYITAYEPIRDLSGKIVGILYVGVLEEKYTDMRKKTTKVFIMIMFLGMLLVVFVSWLLARSIMKPINELVRASGHWAKGKFGHRVEINEKDEIGKLSSTFNFMAESLQIRDKKTKEYTERQMMRSERLATIGQLAAGVAHEINNPLGAILMYQHLALEDAGNKKILRENIGKAVEETARCRDIVKGLLDFSRQTEPKMEEGDLSGILEKTLSLFENQAMFQNIKIVKEIPPSFSGIMMDNGQIQQVFANIIINAAEAMEGKGTLTVTAKRSFNDVEVVFKDTGGGIPRKNIGKIFDPFFSTKEVGRGTGLGLAVSYGIIVKHKGSIDVESRPGRGATFTVRLPAKKWRS